MKNNYTLSSKLINLVSITLLLSLVACRTTNFPFNPIDEKKVYKPSSIAVISGDEHDAHVKLAEFITQGLTDKSTFRVMSQKEIKAKISNYPQSIAIDVKLKNDDEEKPIWFPASEKAKLNSIQAKLKVDYLFVVWNRFVQRVTVTGGNGGSTTDYVYPAGNLIEYPGGKVVASTMSVAGSQLSPLALFRDADYYIKDALKDASEDIVHDFLKVTKSKK